jgi:hypothetical protein
MAGRHVAHVARPHQGSYELAHVGPHHVVPHHVGPHHVDGLGDDDLSDEAVDIGEDEGAFKEQQHSMHPLIAHGHLVSREPRHSLPHGLGLQHQHQLGHALGGHGHHMVEEHVHHMHLVHHVHHVHVVHGGLGQVHGLEPHEVGERPEDGEEVAAAEVGHHHHHHHHHHIHHHHQLQLVHQHPHQHQLQHQHQHPLQLQHVQHDTGGETEEEEEVEEDEDDENDDKAKKDGARENDSEEDEEDEGGSDEEEDDEEEDMGEEEEDDDDQDEHGGSASNRVTEASAARRTVVAAAAGAQRGAGGALQDGSTPLRPPALAGALDCTAVLEPLVSPQAQDGAPRALNEGAKKPRKRWSKAELRRLHKAVARFGRTWAEVAQAVRTRSKKDCCTKAMKEVAAGRMPEPERKAVRNPWTDTETQRLHTAVAKFGRDWVKIASFVGTRSNQDCYKKMQKEVATGRMQEPDSKLKLEHPRVIWSPAEVQRLHEGVKLHGRNWIAVAEFVGSTRTNRDCSKKMDKEVRAGRMAEPDGKKGNGATTGDGKPKSRPWSKEEVDKLYLAVGRFGCDWVSVAQTVASRSRQLCRAKAKKEVLAGRLTMPTVEELIGPYPWRLPVAPPAPATNAADALVVQTN